MGKFGIGQSVRRVEDQRLVTGRGTYTDDVNFPGQTHAFLLRSPHAHAKVGRIDTAAALEAPGVVAIFTGADLAVDGINGNPNFVPLKSSDGTPAVTPEHPLLTSDRVRHVGDPVALIIAETLAQAKDAAELVDVEYDALDSVTGTTQALEEGRPQIWEAAARNRSFDWSMGDEAAVDAAFAKAAHISEITLVNNRVVVASMEGRAAIGSYDAAEDLYTLQATSQGAHTLRDTLATAILNIPKDKLRVITTDVGGGFGMKIFVYAEYALVLWASKRIGRPVKWTSERGEAFVSDIQGRDHVSHAELATDKDGKFLALKVHTIANLGAYLSNFALFIPTLAGSGMLSGVYKIPAIFVRVEGVFTNTVPVDAYRGAGRPEAAYLVERTLDKAALDLGIAPEELRRRNFIQPAEMPYKTVLGITYDSGDFDKNMTDALRIIDQAGFAARKAASRAKSLYRGLGIATYIEQCGGGPGETARLTFDASGQATLLIGTQSTGQGHETAYTQIVADGLGLPVEKIKVFQGDTARIATGGGTGGSRSLPIGGVSTQRAVDKVIERARRVAAHLLEAADPDIEYADGQFTIAGTDRQVAFSAVIDAVFNKNVPEGFDGLDDQGEFTPPVGTYPNGCHACEVEIDPDTGVTTILRYVVVDDFGTVVNPLLLAGQVHGGIAQGVGQALYERTVYDPDSGQLVSGTFMDYQMPRAGDFPEIEFSWNVIPCTTNPLGIKGAGEAGAIGAPPALINAIVDALKELGIKHIDMPATPLRVWQAIQDMKLADAAE